MKRGKKHKSCTTGKCAAAKPKKRFSARALELSLDAIGEEVEERAERGESVLPALIVGGGLLIGLGLLFKFASRGGVAKQLLDRKPVSITPFMQLRFDRGANNDPRLHEGADIAIAVGTPARALLDGVVDFVGDDPNGYGKFLVLKHIVDGRPIRTLYAHLSKVLVSSGPVQHDQVVALTGGERGAPGSGSSSGPHIHFEVILGHDGHIKPSDSGGPTRVDPMAFLKQHGIAIGPGLSVRPSFMVDVSRQRQLLAAARQGDRSHAGQPSRLPV